MPREPERAAPYSDRLGFYKLLEVSQTASPEEMNKAYRRLSETYHPDKPTGSTEASQRLGQAYSILQNQRDLYDMGWSLAGSITEPPPAKRHRSGGSNEHRADGMR